MSTEDLSYFQEEEFKKNLALYEQMLQGGQSDYMEAAELNLVKGQKVRITDGVFKGVIGEFVRIRHDRRVVVNIEGVMAVATTFIHSSLVEPITD